MQPLDSGGGVGGGEKREQENGNTVMVSVSNIFVELKT